MRAAGPLGRSLRRGLAFASQAARARGSRWRPRAVVCMGVGGSLVAAGLYGREAAECSAKELGFVWGRGSAAKGTSTVPESLGLPAQARDVKHLAFSSRFGAAVDRGGNVWTWSLEEGGHPGVAKMSVKGGGVKAVACSERRVYALRSSGSVFSWEPAANPGQEAVREEWIPGGGWLWGGSVVQVDASGGTAACVTSDGRAWASGDGRKGQLGGGRYADFVDGFEPMQLPQGEKALQVAVGGEHCLLLTRNGTVYACGSDDKLQLGQGRESIKEWSRNDDDTVKICSADLKRVHMPRSLEGGKVVSIAAGGEFSAAVVQPPSRIEPTCLVTWGHGQVGQLGHRDWKHVAEPRIVAAFSARKEWDEKAQKIFPIGVKEIACGSEHTIALLTNGAVLSFGGNQQGELGCGSRKATKEPSLVMPLQMHMVSKVFAGSRTSAVLV